jgi:MoxR-like ATPase
MPIATRAEALTANIEKVVRGKGDVVRMVLTAVLAEGHILIQDNPGVGKTTIARALAQSVAGSMGRVQFTPDLLPSDVTGTTIWDRGEQRFRFHEGPIFANIVVADEINRASPKTQSALLQVMEERTHTADRTTYRLPRPFVVVATQNPIDMDGTYPLPEAQLDRFLMQIAVQYPERQAAIEILRGHRSGKEIEELAPVMTTGDLEEMIAEAAAVAVDPSVLGYMVDLAEATRKHASVRVGVSPRGCIALMRAARAHAGLSGRTFVMPEDVKELAQVVLAHRLILTTKAEVGKETTAKVIDEVLDTVPVPRRPSGS